MVTYNFKIELIHKRSIAYIGDSIPSVDPPSEKMTASEDRVGLLAEREDLLANLQRLALLSLRQTTASSLNAHATPLEPHSPCGEPESRSPGLSSPSWR